jgi:hypothetical protein
MLAIFAEISGATLVLNEWAETRGQLLERLFPTAALSRVDGAQIKSYGANCRRADFYACTRQRIMRKHPATPWAVAAFARHGGGAGGDARFRGETRRL